MEWAVRACGSFFFSSCMGVNMMRCSSLNGSGSLDEDCRVHIVCVIPPLSLFILVEMLSILSYCLFASKLSLLAFILFRNASC